MIDPKKQIFISYSKKDRNWLEKHLLPQLQVLKKYNKILYWYDKQLQTGQEWRPQIQKEIDSSQVFIFIVTTNFLNSTFIIDKELPAILEKGKKVQLLPLLIDPCLWDQNQSLRDLQFYPDNAKPLSKFDDQEKEEQLIGLMNKIISFYNNYIPENNEQKLTVNDEPESDTNIELISNEQHMVIFDPKKRLEQSLFGFEIDQVLFRSGKRMIFQNRRKLTVTDFVAGLFRKGALTRFMIKEWKQSPDKIYYKLMNLKIDNNNTKPVQRNKNRNLLIEELFEKILFAEYDLFDNNTLEFLFETANDVLNSEDENKDHSISEQDIIIHLYKTDICKDLSKYGLMPSLSQMKKIISQRERVQRIDENGFMYLDMLSDSGKKIIDIAHYISQQKGVFPIPHRLVFAAFQIAENKKISNIFKQENICPELLSVLMLIITKSEKRSRRFGLSFEACEYILEKMLSDVMRIAEDPLNVNDIDLFCSFCDSAVPSFKNFLKEFQPSVDLSKLKRKLFYYQDIKCDQLSTETNKLDLNDQASSNYCSQDQNINQKIIKRLERYCFAPDVIEIIEQSIQTSIKFGSTEIKPEYLFRAMREFGKGPISKFFQKAIPPYVIVINKEDSELTDLSKKLKKILNGADKLSQIKEKKVIDEFELYVAYFACGGDIDNKLKKKVINSLMKSICYTETQDDESNIESE